MDNINSKDSKKSQTEKKQKKKLDQNMIKLLKTAFTFALTAH